MQRSTLQQSIRSVGHVRSQRNHLPFQRPDVATLEYWHLILISGAEQLRHRCFLRLHCFLLLAVFSNSTLVQLLGRTSKRNDSQIRLQADHPSTPTGLRCEAASKVGVAAQRNEEPMGRSRRCDVEEASLLNLIRVFARHLAHPAKCDYRKL